MREGLPTSHALRLVNMASIYFVRGGVTRMPPGSGFLKPLDFALHALCIMSLRECSPGIPGATAQRSKELPTWSLSLLLRGGRRNQSGQFTSPLFPPWKHQRCRRRNEYIIREFRDPMHCEAKKDDGLTKSRLFQLPMSISASVFHDMSSLKINYH